MTSACATTNTVLASVRDDQLDVAEAVLAHLAAFAADGPVEGLFGRAVEVPDGATVFEQALALSGRHPGWRSANGS